MDDKPEWIDPHPIRSWFADHFVAIFIGVGFVWIAWENWG